MGNSYRRIHADGTSTVITIPESKVDTEFVDAAIPALDAEDSGKDFIVRADALTITLPQLPPKGTLYNFINGGADGAVALTIAPGAGAGIVGSIANALADAVASGVADKDWVNTKATANKGDRCALVYDGGGIWYITEGIGIWASEA